MAEKIILAEIDLNVKKATSDAADLAKKIKQLQEAQLKEKELVGDTSEKYIKLTAQLKNTKKEYNSQVNLIGKVSAAGEKQVGTLQKLEAANAKLRNEQKSLDLTTKQGIKRNKEINKEINTNTSTISKNSDATKQNKINIGNYTSALGGFGGALGGASNAMKAFGIATKFALGPIAIIIAAFAAMVSYLKRSEEGQDKLAKVTKIFTTVLDNLLDIIDEVGKKLFSAIEDPKKAWENFVGFIKGVGTFFQNTFGNIIGGAINEFVANLGKGFANIGLAWQKFKGLFVDNADGIKESQDKIAAYNDKITDSQKRQKDGVEALGKGIQNAYDKAKDALKNFSDEMKSDLEIAKKLADEEASIRKEERKDLVENAKLSGESAKLRAEAEEQKFLNAQKSIDLYSKSFDLDEKRLANELEIANRKATAAKVSASLAKSDIETLDKIAQLEADVENKRAAFDEVRRGRTRRLNAIRKEAFVQEQDRLKTQLESEQIAAEQTIRLNNRVLDNELSTLNERQNALNENTNLISDLLEKETQMKIDAIQAEADLRLLSEEAASEQIMVVRQDLADQQLQLLNDTIEATREIMEEEKARQLEVAQMDLENDMAAAEGTLFTELDLERKALQLKQKQEVDFANKIGADVEKVNQKYAKAQRALDQAEFNAKLALTAGFTANLATIFGEQTAIGKAAAVASATISTIQGAINSYNSLSSIPVVGPVLGAVAAAAALAAGYAQVKEILAVKSGLPGDTGGGSAPSGASMNVPIPSIPTQNRESGAGSVGAGIVSRDTTDTTSQSIANGMNQALSENALQPTLVTDDVTISQSQNIDKNKTATI